MPKRPYNVVTVKQLGAKYMTTNAEKSQLLNAAVDLLERADALIQRALGDSDMTYEYCTQLQNIVDDLVGDIAEFDCAE